MKRVDFTMHVTESEKWACIDETFLGGTFTFSHAFIMLRKNLTYCTSSVFLAHFSMVRECLIRQWEKRNLSRNPFNFQFLSV